MSSSDLPWVAVIPARYGSSRFPGKPLVRIAGVPLILRVAERVSRVPGLSRVLVATDDDRIESVCRGAGLEVARTSPACMTGTDRVWEAVREFEECRVINVQGDEPLIEPDSVLAVMQRKLDFPGAVINAQAPVETYEEAERRTVPKMVSAADGRLLYASRALVPASNKAADGRAPLEMIRKQVCIYAFDRWQLERFGSAERRLPLEAAEDIEIVRFLEMGIEVRVVDVAAGTCAVDVPEDVDRVEALLGEVGRRQARFSDDRPPE